MANEDLLDRLNRGRPWWYSPLRWVITLGLLVGGLWLLFSLLGFDVF